MRYAVFALLLGCMVGCASPATTRDKWTHDLGSLVTQDKQEDKATVGVTAKTITPAEVIAHAPTVKKDLTVAPSKILVLATGDDVALDAEFLRSALSNFTQEHPKESHETSTATPQPRNRAVITPCVWFQIAGGLLLLGAVALLYFSKTSMAGLLAAVGVASIVVGILLDKATQIPWPVYLIAGLGAVALVGIVLYLKWRGRFVQLGKSVWKKGAVEVAQDFKETLQTKSEKDEVSSVLKHNDALLKGDAK